MYKSAFWLIAHLVYNPSDLEIVRTEVLPAIKGDQIDHHHLTKNCPILDSLMSEVLRITTSTPIVRDVMEDICIGGTTLRKGNKMLVRRKKPLYNIMVNTCFSRSLTANYISTLNPGALTLKRSKQTVSSRTRA